MKIRNALTTMVLFAACSAGAPPAATTIPPANSKPTTDPQGQPQEAAEVQAAPEPNPVAEIAEKESLDEALVLAGPLMSDTFNEESRGTLLLAIWATKHLTWADLLKIPETKIALVKKDPDAHRGQRICRAGTIIEIQAQKTPLGSLFRGGMYLPSGDIIRFMAAGSTGELVDSSYARYCGIVTGKFDYSNSAGGTAHAIATVGMFQIPENTGQAVPVKRVRRAW